MDVIYRIANIAIYHMSLTQSVKGVTRMSNRQVQSFVKSLVNTYSKIYDHQHTLSVYDPPDFVRHEFAALIIANDPSYASEATGPDNDLWESKMLPALLSYLKNSTDVDASIKFNNTWKECVTAYLIPYMQKLIDDEISDYNTDDGFIFNPKITYGVQAHGSI